MNGIMIRDEHATRTAFMRMHLINCNWSMICQNAFLVVFILRSGQLVNNEIICRVSQNIVPESCDDDDMRMTYHVTGHP